MIPNYDYRVLWHEPDQCYFAIVPDVPELAFISAFGDTPAEAIKELMVALEGVAESYLEEGQELPLPKRLAPVM
ncbi:MAG: type II toxin-antitoxin system HicB family antitoxin [Ardenticatenaceae bacterium]